jgi:UDP-N-acetylmuramate-alanine ligase
MDRKQKHLHVIGIGGIGVSALARYYQHLGYTVSGSDGSDSPFLERLRSEGFEIFIGHNAKNLPDSTDLVIYSEAIITKPDLTPEEQIYSNPELAKAKSLGIRHISYPVASRWGIQCEAGNSDHRFSWEVDDDRDDDTHARERVYG